MDCSNAVYSEDYYDVIVVYNDRSEVFQLPPCVQTINEQYLVGYWNRTTVPSFNFRNYTYTSIPKLYMPLDELAMEASGIIQIQNQPTLSLKGQGVLVGIIDTGIDYLNPIFQNVDGTTRIMAIWDQEVRDGEPPAGFIYGTEYRKEQIDEALESEEPLRVVPSRDEDGHGTYLASLAAGGANLENEFIGAAPFAGIAVVKLKEAKDYLRDFFFVPRDARVYQENDIMAGIAYLDQLAYELNMPLSICIGLGTNQGAHAGVGPLSGFLNQIVSRRMRAASIAAGNEANKRHHFYGTIAENDSFEEVEINVEENVSGFVLELWSGVSELFSVEVISPTGERIPRLSRQESSRDYTFIFENTRVSIEENITFATQDYVVTVLRFANPTQGLWNIRVYAEEIIRGGFHMWLPMEGAIEGDVYFIRSNPDTTITVPGNARYPMTVGGYDATNDSIYLNSGRGYSLSGVVKPDFVAPAVEVLGAGLRNRFVRRTGTSAAAAITTGAAALILEWAIVRGNNSRITANDIKSILIRGAERDPQELYPNREWGYGRLNLYEAFSELRNT